MVKALSKRGLDQLQLLAKMQVGLFTWTYAGQSSKSGAEPEELLELKDAGVVAHVFYRPASMLHTYEFTELGKKLYLLLRD